jgi:L-asparaginase II
VCSSGPSARHDGRVSTEVDARSYAPLAATTRSGFGESLHHGAVVVVGSGGDVVLSVGDPDVAVYPRSSMKPLQADAMLRAGFTGDDEQVALACASHVGTPRHLAIVESILIDAGLTGSALRNTPDWPLDRESAERLIAHGAERTPLYMNCSGKHAAMVATCVGNGWDVDGYLDPEHPLQRAITQRVSELAGDVIHIGVDGCGAPAHVVRLSGLASAVLAIADERGTVWRAMSEHPVLVGGERRPSARLVAQSPGFLAKEGAEGMFVAARPGGPALAVKVADGAGRAAGFVAAAALAAVGVDIEPSVIGNPIMGHGEPVGEIRALIGQG